VLTDPKVTIHFDDGRRWLNRHPEAKFDFILMNTTWHWRNMISNLVSADFLRLCKAHLKPGGVIYYNATGSEDILYTAAREFKHVVKYSTFVAASDAPFDQTPEERRANLLRFVRRDPERPGSGTVIFHRDADHRAVLEEMAHAPLPDLGEALRARTDLWLITDDNMATEFKGRNRP
jgi:SAM-dependent methyltransferase